MNKYEAAKILNLPSIYSRSELKTAHRYLAFQHHPDRGGDRLRFIEIQEAYELLSARTTADDDSILEEDKIDGRVVSELGNKDKSKTNCRRCEGLGYTYKREETGREVCIRCHGTGNIHVRKYKGREANHLAPCRACNGIGWTQHGRYVRHVCEDCQGSGQAKPWNPVTPPGAILV